MRRQDSIRRKYRDWFICDIDAHHVETVSWKEIIAHIEDPVVREQAIHFQAERINAPPYGLNGDLGLRYQSVGGRIPHQDGQRETITEDDVHRDVVLTRRAMEVARHRLHGGVPDPDAVPRHASAAGNGGVARPRL